MGRKEYEAIIGAMYDSLEVIAHNEPETEFVLKLIEKHEREYEKRYGKPYRKREIQRQFIFSGDDERKQMFNYPINF